MRTSGRCLCGKVEFAISYESKTFDSCHCSMCRRWGGGPAFAVAVDGIEFKNHDSVKVYDSSDWAERGFCSDCGSHLFYRLKNGSYTCVFLGLLEHQSEFAFTTQIYVDHKPASYDFSNKTKMMTEAEVLEAFGAK